MLVIWTLIMLFFASQASVDRTYFNYLGLTISATPQQINQAYQQKKFKVQSIEDDQQRMKKKNLLEQAYKILSNEKQRGKYERYGKDVFKLINQISSIDPYNNNDFRKGRTLQLKVSISTPEIYNGTIIQAKYLKNSACRVCYGTGAKSPKAMSKCEVCAGKGFMISEIVNRGAKPVKLQKICNRCKGSGKIITSVCQHCDGLKVKNNVQIVQFAIPKGVSTGSKLLFRNYGDQSTIGAPSDFEITIVEVPTKQWLRKDKNLLYTMQITLQQSIFGFNKYFIHLNGEQLNIQRKDITTKETRITINGKGIINEQKGIVGNLIITFKIIIPQFNDKQLDMWQDFFIRHDM